MPAAQFGDPDAACGLSGSIELNEDVDGLSLEVATLEVDTSVIPAPDVSSLVVVTGRPGRRRPPAVVAFLPLVMIHPATGCPSFSRS